MISKIIKLLISLQLYSVNCKGKLKAVEYYLQKLFFSRFIFYRQTVNQWRMLIKGNCYIFFI